MPFEPLSAGIAAGGSVLGGVIGGLFNKSSTDSANAANIQLAKENREWQAEQNQLSRDWQTKMWQAQNAYNTPSAQMARYQAAGLNPYLVDSNITGSVAGSAGTPGQSGAPSMAQVRPVDYTGLGSSISSGAIQAAQLLQQKQAVDANSANQRAQAMATIASAAAQIYRAIGPEAARKFYQNNLDSTLQGYDPDNSQASRMMEEEISRIRLENSNQKMLNAVFEQYGAKRAELLNKQIDQTIQESLKKVAEIDARIENLRSGTAVNQTTLKKILAEAYELGTRAANNLAQAGLANANAKTVNGISDYVIDMYDNNSTISMYNRLGAGYDFQDKQANFNWNNGVRRWMQTPFGQDSRLATFTSSSDNNPFFSFLKGFREAIGGSTHFAPQIGSGFGRSSGYGYNQNATPSVNVQNYQNLYNYGF